MKTFQSKLNQLGSAQTGLSRTMLTMAMLTLTAVLVSGFDLPPTATVPKNALLFKGDNNQHVEVSRPADFNLTSNFTIETWVNVTVWDSTRWQAIVTKGDAWGIVRNDRNQNVIFRTVSGNTTHDLAATMNLTPGLWYHLAAVYDGTRKYLYIDGQLNTSAAYSATVNINAIPVAFASNLQFAGQRNFKGTFDTTRIWASARTATEIAADFRRDLRGDEPGLLGEWRFNEPSGTVALDSSLGQRHGTLRNMVEADRVHGIQFRFAAPVATVPANAIRFDGDSRQRIELDEYYLPDFTWDPAALTVEAWVNFAGFDGPGEAIVTKGDAWGLIRPGGRRKLVFRTDGVDLTSAADLLPNRWYHVAAVLKENEKLLYIDGLLDNSSSYSPPPPDGSPPVTVVVGNNAAAASQAFHGDIDLVRVWATNRTQVELNATILRELRGSEPGLLAEWRFNEPSGDQALDSSFKEQHAHLVNLPAANRVNGLALQPPLSPVAQAEKSALKFDSASGSSSVSIQNEQAFDLLDGLTIEAWMNVAEWTHAWQPIVTKGEAWGITRLGETGKIAFRTHLGHAAADLASTTELGLNRWYHVAAVFDGARKYLYIDGKLDSSTAFTGTLLQNNHPVAIGGNAERTDRNFKGVIDNVRIWSEPRSAAEVAGHFERVMRGSEFGLLGEWRFDEASGSEATDSSWNGNHGQLASTERVNGLALRAPARGNLAVYFNMAGASGQYAEVPVHSALNFQKQLTVECWVWFPDYPIATVALVSKGASAWEVKLRPSGKIQFSTAGLVDSTDAPRVDLLSAATLSRQEWHHVAVTWDPIRKEKRIFINGRLDEVERGLDGTLGQNNSPVLFAAEPFASGRVSFFRGVLDEVRLWESARLDEQILQSFNRHVNGTEPRLVGAWSMNEGSGRVLRNREVGSILHGELSAGMPPWSRVDGVALGIPVPSQYALTFDGAGDYIQIPHHTDYNLVVGATLEAWIKPDGTEVRPIVSKGDAGYGLALDANNFVRFYIDALHTSALSSSRPVPNGAWSHVAVVVNVAAGTTTFYIDGKPAGMHNLAVLRNNEDSLYIGKRGNLFFIGQIDEVRLWKVARSPLEIEFLAFGQLPLDAIGLAGYWGFNTGAGQVAVDGSRNHNDGTLYGDLDSNWIEGHVWGVPSLEQDLNFAVDPSAAGLWIGQVILNKVNEVQKAINGVAEELTPTADTAAMRILLHVNAQGQARLLKDIIVMRTRQNLNDPNSPQATVLVTDPNRIHEYEGAVRRASKPVGLRYGSATFDFEGNELPLLGGVGAGVACAGLIRLSEEFPTNPFRHKYHPDHRKGYEIRRQFSIRFDGQPGDALAEAPGFGVHRLSGVYRETILGLHKVPLKIEGTVNLNRISSVSVLNDQP
jgi:hypothetical protein